MLNYNPWTHIPTNNTVWKSKQLVPAVSNIEKQEIISSLLFLGPNFNDFVDSFYKTYQERKTDNFLLSSSEESLVNMLSSSLNLIITSLEQPSSLNELAPTLIERYPNFKSLLKDNDVFLRSFMEALVDTFKNNYNDRLGLLWYRAVSEFSRSINLIMKN